MTCPRTKPLIAVIDDEETQRLLSRSYLEAAGYAVETAADGHEGLTLCRLKKPDLVLLDVEMPGMSGFDLCRLMRNDPDLATIPIAIVTGREADADIQQGFALGVVDFLTKPIVWSLLAHRVRFIMADQKRQRELAFARDAAEQASRAKSALLATMSHELQTPLNAVVGLSGMMRDEALGPLGAPEYAEFSQTILEAGLQLSDCISDILEIAQSAPGEAVAAGLEEVDLCDLLDAAAQQHASLAADKGVQLSVLPNIPALSIMGDCERLQQAVGRLIDNSIRFNGAGGAVTLSAGRLDSDELAIQVSDDGPGCAPDMLDRIAEPFFKAESNPSEQQTGLGLGASVARAVATAHGGALEFDARPGGGLIASLRLPPSILRTTGAQPPSVAERPIAATRAGVEAPL